MIAFENVAKARKLVDFIEIFQFKAKKCDISQTVETYKLNRDVQSALLTQIFHMFDYLINK